MTPPVCGGKVELCCIKSSIARQERQSVSDLSGMVGLTRAQG